MLLFSWFSPLEITLNVRDPPTKITIIPENKVKADWKLPEVKYRFITRLGFFPLYFILIDSFS